MVDKTVDAEELSREAVAERLRELADALDGEGEAQVRVGNKGVTLHPASSIAYEIGIMERSSVLRGSREGVTVKLDWKP